MARGSLVGPGTARALALDGAAPPVLALHGFGGTPLEVELVIEAARELGLRAAAPLLPGHGTHVRDLARTTWEDWVAAARAAFEQLAASGPVVVAGLSMGSLLAAHLAATEGPRVRGLVMLANAVWLARPWPSLPLRALRALHAPDFWIPKAGADLADPEASATHLTYDAQPLHAALEVLRAGERVREELGRIRAPALVIHGAKDRVCPASNARRVMALLGSSRRRVVIMPRSRHIVTRDYDKGAVLGELVTFLRELTGAAHAPVEP
ncbi:MAG: alpha/beta fold hydrolase [Sorangiineae bacterium]|nr:alpha/beta fold hydrolase [Polyangiaceae bacterium]MEB2323921.1 alpha/beta fold hydrolase [Sorangiineae bacterium]